MPTPATSPARLTNKFFYAIATSCVIIIIYMQHMQPHPHACKTESRDNDCIAKQGWSSSSEQVEDARSIGCACYLSPPPLKWGTC